MTIDETQMRRVIAQDFIAGLTDTELDEFIAESRETGASANTNSHNEKRERSGSTGGVARGRDLFKNRKPVSRAEPGSEYFHDRSR